MSPRWLLTAVWIGGLAIAALATYLFSAAVDTYVAAHSPLTSIDFEAVPAPTTEESVQATLAAVLLPVGLVAAWVALFIRARRTAGGWLLLRALAALVPIALAAFGLRGYFQVVVYTLCGDCGPPAPDNPALDVFSRAGVVLIAAVPISVVVSLVLVVFAIVGFVRSRRPA